MEDIPECKYHIFLTTLTELINDKLDEPACWDASECWLGNASDFGKLYKDTFQLYTNLFKHEPFTEEQLDLVETKGKALEQAIRKWLDDWKVAHPTFPNQHMGLSCLKHKIYEFVLSQLNESDMKPIVGESC